ncbi:CD63 antigen-like isoform X2 [Watersipora subatra]|uniref:CD63 antigen-like isoform X2 n=1 Tax=Watersipora subatra TaxID=2589382 RepID=UPI00355B967A
MVEKGMSCVKYLLFAFNLLFFIFGAVLIGVGAYVQVKLSDYLQFFEAGSANATALLLIVVGALTLVIGFFGCCGAIKENNCMVMTFAVLIALILIAEIGGGIAAYVFRADVEDLLTSGMNDTLQKYGEDEGITNLWNETQSGLHCCGVNGYQDWLKLLGKVPVSCCTNGTSCSTPKDYYGEGCFDKIKEAVMSNIAIVGGIAIGLGVVEFLGIVFACCLGKAIRSEDRYV